MAAAEVKRKGRIPTSYTLHPKDMMTIGALVEKDIQEHVRASSTPSGQAQTRNKPATIAAKGHSVPLIGGGYEKHRFVDAKWDRHPGFGVVLLSLPKHGIQPSAWDVAKWLTRDGRYKPIMSISQRASKEIVQFVIFRLRKLIAEQARRGR